MTKMAVVHEGLTLEEFLQLPEEKPALQYFQGRVTQKVSPLGEHSALQLECAEYLNRLFRPNRIARAFTELRGTFGGASLVPDVSLYRWDRVPRTPSGRIATYFREPPDVSVEIRSAGQSVRELVEKCEWFIANGVLIALLVDHSNETFRVFRPGEPVRTCRVGDAIDLAEIASGAQLDVAEVFNALLMD
jgi:Uma2 family endonuclease